MGANTTITEETRRKLEAFAGEGADALADKVLSEYLKRQELGQKLEGLASYGRKHAVRMGYKPSDVARAITESRSERRGR